VSNDPSELAIEYQRRLRALHQAQSELAELQAAIRRLQIDRPHLNVDDAARQQQQLDTAQQQVAVRVAQRRAEAEAARREFRLNSEGGIEPAELATEEPVPGFEQPPFADPH